MGVSGDPLVCVCVQVYHSALLQLGLGDVMLGLCTRLTAAAEAAAAAAAAAHKAALQQQQQQLGQGRATQAGGLRSSSGGGGVTGVTRATTAGARVTSSGARSSSGGSGDANSHNGSAVSRLCCAAAGWLQHVCATQDGLKALHGAAGAVGCLKRLLRQALGSDG
jgi:hypothetical protein